MYNWLVSRLDHPSGQCTGCSLLNWPFLEAHRLVPKQTPTVGWIETAISLFLSLSLFSVFSVPPPFTSLLVLYLHSHPLNPEYFLFVSLSFCHWYLCFIQVCLSNCSCKSLLTLWAWRSTYALKYKYNPHYLRLQPWAIFLCAFQPFATLWTVARQASLSVGYSRQEHWSGLPFPSPGELSDPRSRYQVYSTGRWIRYH